ncbi:GntR family transcriptional regulator [Dellaglioa sp. L3N]
MYRYREIYSDIKRDILTNHYRAGALLPTQEILTEKYEVSRLTLKKSLNLLSDEGLIYSKQGSGTYVRPRMDSQSAETLPLDLPIGVTYSHRDQKITSKLLYFNARLPTELEQKNLQILSNDPVYEIKRIRLINHQVYSFEHSVMPVAIAPIDEKILAGSVYDYLGSHANLQLTDARRVVYAEPANAETSQALEVSVNSPIFVIDQIAYDQKGRAFEYSTSRFVSDHNKFVLDVHLNKTD